MKNRATILFGGNKGNVASTFEDVTKSLTACGVAVIRSSSDYASPPWGFESEDWFLNRVVEVETDQTPEGLLELLLKIEEENGRVRLENEGYHSRTIDLDILFFGEELVNQHHLHIPHPRMHLRRFTMLPLVELDPNRVHPVLQKTMLELLADCPDSSEVLKKDK